MFIAQVVILSEVGRRNVARTKRQPFLLEIPQRMDLHSAIRSFLLCFG